jgi:opacity protein-like surface antigen
MRRVWPVLAVVTAALASLVLPSTSLAADDPTAESLRAGSRALLFEITDDFQLGSFDGGAVSYKWHTSESAAWRFGLSFGGTLGRDTDEFRESVIDSTPPVTSTTHTDSGAQSVAIDLTRVIYPAVEGRVRPFWGLGPAVSYAHSSDSRLQTDQDQNRRTIDTSSTQWAAGLGVKLGVEVFAARRVSVLAEYGTSFDYFHQHDETDTRTDLVAGPPNISETLESTTHGFQIGNQAVRLGVSAYF